MIVDYSNDLLRNVHRDISAPEGGQSFLVRGDYEYWHYGCDGFNDKVCNCSFWGYDVWWENVAEKNMMKC